LHMHREMATQLVNFDDMIYMPVVSGVKLWQNNWVFVDEAQDTNPARRALARKMLSPFGRTVWVGDRHQAIYGFTGADADAIDRITEDFKCASLPLTITYRCPKAVVEEAQKNVSHIVAHDDAPEGSVVEMQCKAFLKDDVVKTLVADDAILCRKIRPLVSLAYSLIQRGVACHVEGREIGAGLIALINHWRKVKTIDALRKRLEVYADSESQKLIAKGRETQAEAVRDRVETIYVLIDAQPPATSLDDLKRRINEMFQDSEHERKPTLTLSTVHKAKGREWPRVFVWGRDDYMPSAMARQVWQVEQENNLIYVAVTRAQRELILVNGCEVRR
jgi:DNA helicase-2/ATP-dependent DNA helicase PcrA